MSRAFRIVLFLSAILKIVLALVFADLPTHYDEAEFLNYGRAIEAGAPAQIWRAPGYQWFIAAGLELAGGRVVGVRLLQVLLSIATSWLVYRIGRKRWGERAGFWAGTFFAFYPSLVAFSHLLWSETLYIFLVVAAADRLLELDDRSRWRDAVVAGLFLGGATLTRSLGIAVTGASCAWLVWGRWSWRSVANATVVGVVGALTVLPWTLEASKRAGTFVATDLNGGFNFWLGHDEYIAPDLPSNWIVGIGLDANMGSRYFDFLPDSIWRQEVFDRLAREGIPRPFGPEGVRWFRQDAWREIREHPGAALSRFPKKVAALWAPDFFLPRHLARDWYGLAPTTLVIALWLLTWAAAAIPLIVGPAAVAAMQADRFRSLTVFYIVTYVFVHGMAYGHTRMHQPLVPLLVLCVAACLFDARGRVPLERWWKRGAAWAALACALWLVAYPVLVTIYFAPSTRHASLIRVLTVGRHLPLPGAHRLDWLLAGVEYTRGGDAVANADQILADSRAAEHPWTLYLRGWISDDPARAERFFRRALERDPVHYPALEMLLWIRRSRGDLREASELEARLVAARPWKADAIDAGELLPSRRADEWNLDAATAFPPASWLPR